jgi:hypothetical protein
MCCRGQFSTEMEFQADEKEHKRGHAESATMKAAYL